MDVELEECKLIVLSAVTVHKQEFLLLTSAQVANIQSQIYNITRKNYSLLEDSTCM
jgi:hypothetical protein